MRQEGGEAERRGEEARGGDGEERGGDLWRDGGAAVLKRRWWRCKGDQRHGAMATALQRGSAAWRDGGGGNGDVVMVGVRSGGGSSGTDACGCGGGDRGWTPSPTFREQPLEMDETPLFSQMTASVCGGGGPFPSYRAQNGPRGERAYLRLTTKNLNILIEIRFTKQKGFTNRIPKREEPTRKPKREREISEDPLK